MKPKPKTHQTELRRTREKAARRLAKEAAEREWRVFLTAKFDRTWKAMIRFRAKVRSNRFREPSLDKAILQDINAKKWSGPR
jgi:hypothetical protein